MIRIRLARGGVKHNPFYKIVVIGKSQKREGKPLDVIGYYYPIKDDKKIDKELLKQWLEKGAQPSDTVKKLFNI